MEISGKIAFFGASVTAQKKENGYSGHWETLLTQAAPPGGIETVWFAYPSSQFYNAGLFGLQEVVEAKPDFAVIEWHTIGQREFDRGQWFGMLQYLVLNEIVPIVLVLPRLDMNSSDPKYSMIREYPQDCSTLRALVPIIDLTDGLEIVRSNGYLRDGIHTTPEGGAFYAGLIHSRLKDFPLDLGLFRETAKSLGSHRKALEEQFRSTRVDIDSGFAVTGHLTLHTKAPLKGVFTMMKTPRTPQVRLTVIDQEGRVLEKIFPLVDPWCYYERENMDLAFSLPGESSGTFSLVQSLPDYQRLCPKLLEQEYQGRQPKTTAELKWQVLNLRLISSEEPTLTVRPE